MADNICVSVIIPVYNAEKYIRECLLSINSQSLKELEIICVDDGSADNSAEIIKGMMEDDRRIKYIHQENKGAPAARNNGLRHSSGKYCMFFDSDDILYPDALESMVELIEKENADIVMGDYNDIDADGQLIQKVSMESFSVKKNKSVYENDEKYLCTKFQPLPGNKLLRKSVLIDSGLEFYDLKIGQDLNFYLKFISLCSKVCILNKCVFGYRVLDGSISRQYSLKILDICNGMNDVKQFYSSDNKDVFYKKYVSVVELIAYRSQLKKMKYFSDKDQLRQIYETLNKAQKSVVYSPSIYIKNYIKEKIKIALILSKYKA